LRQANRLFEHREIALSRERLATIEAEDFRGSRVFQGGAHTL